MRKTILSLALISAFAASAIAATAPSTATLATIPGAILQAKNGADDPVGGEHGPGHKNRLAKNGADDPVGGDGPGHKNRLA